MSKSKASVLVAVLLLTFCCKASPYTVVDMFLDIVGVPGESTDVIHTNQVEVLAWSWGMTHSGATHTGGGSASQGKLSFQNLNLTKYLDKASPLIMSNCAQGTHLPKAILYVRKNGINPIEYVKIQLTNVMMTSVANGGSTDAGRLTENISLNFAKAQMDYIPRKPDGRADTPILFRWDIPGNFGTVIGPVSGLTCSLVYTNGSPIAALTWDSIAGVNYQIWTTSDLNTPFQKYGGSTTSSGNGITSVTVPANAISKFFRVETLSGL